MGENSPTPKILVGIILVLAVIGLISNTTFLGNVTQNFSVSVCVNTPPLANISCSMSYTEDDTIDCYLGYDANGDTLSYSLVFLDGYSLFLINSEGHAYQVLDGLAIGNHTFNLTVTDNSGCQNNQAKAQYTMTIEGVTNHPPYLVKDIPNQKWAQDTTLIAFDLDNYFDDVDGDILVYNVTPNDNIKITIDSNNRVTLDPNNGYYGVEYVLFTAIDPFNATAISNWVRLEVEKEEDVQEEEQVEKTPSVSSSMPSMGGAMQIKCFPEWECEEWSDCYPQGVRIRDCTDKKSCNISIYKPNTTESCQYTPTCFDKIKNGLEEGVDCGGLCDNLCPKKEEKKELTDTPKEECEGEGCNKEAFEESPALIDKDLMMKIGIILGILLALIIIAYESIKHRIAIKRFIKRSRRLFRKDIIAPVSNDSPLSTLDQLELKLEEMKTENALPIIANALKQHVQSLLQSITPTTNEDMIKEIAGLKTDRRINSSMIGLLKELNEYEYSTSISITKLMVQSLIYEARNMIILTGQNAKQVNYNKLVNLKEEKETDSIYNMLIETNINMMNKDINGAKLSYMAIYSQVQKNRIDDVGIINSIRRVHSVLGYCNESR